MSIDAMNTDYDDDFKVKSFGFQSLPADATIKVEDREDSVAIRKTQSIAATHLTPDVPLPSDASLQDRVTVGAPTPMEIEPETAAPKPMDIESEAKPASDIGSMDSLNTEELLAMKVDLEAQNENLQKMETELESNIESLLEMEAALINQNPPEPAILQFPNLALEAVNVGLEKEKHTNAILNGHIAEAQKSQKDIDLLLDLSAELLQHKAADGENIEMSDKLKDLLKQLQERGIDLWKSEETSLSKEKLSELKTLSSAQVDKLRSSIQLIFTTKIQTLIQAMGAILECVKDIIRNHNKLISGINNKMTTR